MAQAPLLTLIFRGSFGAYHHGDDEHDAVQGRDELGHGGQS
jgi:hypothetical protein